MKLLLLRVSEETEAGMKGYVEIVKACHGDLIDPGHALMGKIVEALEIGAFGLEIKMACKGKKRKGRKGR